MIYLGKLGENTGLAAAETCALHRPVAWSIILLEI